MAQPVSPRVQARRNFFRRAYHVLFTGVAGGLMVVMFLGPVAAKAQDDHRDKEARNARAQAELAAFNAAYNKQSDKIVADFLALCEKFQADTAFQKAARAQARR